MKAPRIYEQRARAEAAEQTRRSIIGAAVELWRERAWDEVTLAAIAERAGVTVQTVLRRFGSKDGLVDACIAEGASNVDDLRNRAEVGDLDSAITAILAHYERDGDAVLRMLEIEHRSPAAQRIVAHGRVEHRAWCARIFAPFLPSARAKTYEAHLDAFVAATDIYLWKLFRCDLGRTESQTRAAVAALLRGLTSPAEKGRRR